ncbi:18 kDa heat shock protein [Novipirellula aureliae]|uniref:18 kDa heat shock protein n=1 Tax=Novipirellula aureliae TaxID=2527966 RepID=A0A5C6E485_9BACT|nr:Hsp20/alpha crystallin family protein [Novipirellula aureliae]TWU43485.1 18 kDa heat shock protein [Novipirellula aureliae]
MRFNIPWASELNRLQEEMERVFGDGARESLLRPRAYPPVNIWEDDDNLYVESEIPGMELDEFELLSSDENSLTIQGERKKPANGSSSAHRQERSFGRFSRIIQLPASVDADKTSAQYKAGVLKIMLAKKEEAKPRHITVTAG